MSLYHKHRPQSLDEVVGNIDKVSYKSGIYCIYNIKNGKMYIGSSKDLKSRFRDHRRALYFGQDSKHLQRAWDKYGRKSFEFKVLIRCSAERQNLLFQEQYMIDLYNATNPSYGYNLALKADSNLGYKHNEQSRQNMSEAHKGKKLDPETIKKMKGKVPWNKDKIGVYTKETLAKIGESNKGNKKMLGFCFTEESKRKMSESHKGKPAWNKGVKEHQTAWNKGVKCSEKTKKKLSESHKGYVMSEEQKQKISASMKSYWKNKQNNIGDKNDTLS